MSSSQQGPIPQLASPRQLVTPGGIPFFLVLLQLFGSAQNFYCSGNWKTAFRLRRDVGVTFKNDCLEF